MQKQDLVICGLMACALTGLPITPTAWAISSASKEALPLYDPPRPFLTKDIEVIAHRDQFRLTRQKCTESLCVTCFVSVDSRHLLGETWTSCAPDAGCVWLNTTPQMEEHHVPFGACERDEVPPIAKGE